MVIIPTEKRFDWNHAPLVLFSLVLLCIIIFFIFQSGDDEKFNQAYSKYQQQQYLKLEWPFLQRYLQENQQEATLKQLEADYQQNQYQSIIGHILLDSGFYQYLRRDQYDYFHQNDVGDWFIIREEINNLIQSTVILRYGLIPADLGFFSTLSYQFLHGNVMHLLGNLFFLIVCGFAVEAAIGRWRFLLFYLICGICGGLLHALFNSSTATPLVGASGAISGTMAMYLGLFRLKKIEFFYWFFIFVGYFRAPAMLILVFYIGKELYQLFTDNASNVAFLAHVGGFVAGAALMAVSYKINPSMFNQEYIEEDQSIDPLQEKKATIYEFLGKYQFDAAAKAIARVIDEQGLSFELAQLRYNVEKIQPNKQFLSHTLEFLTLPALSQPEIDKLDAIWQEAKTLLPQLNDKIHLRVALNLSSCSSPKTAIEVIEQLQAQTAYHPHLAIIAKKVAATFARDNNGPMQTKYLKLQQHFMAASKS